MTVCAHKVGYKCAITCHSHACTILPTRWYQAERYHILHISTDKDMFFFKVAPSLCDSKVCGTMRGFTFKTRFIATTPIGVRKRVNQLDPGLVQMIYVPNKWISQGVHFHVVAVINPHCISNLSSRKINQIVFFNEIGKICIVAAVQTGHLMPSNDSVTCSIVCRHLFDMMHVFQVTRNEMLYRDDSSLEL